MDDDSLEGVHDFTVEIESTTPQLTIGTPATATVIIKDNEGTSIIDF